MRRLDGNNDTGGKAKEFRRVDYVKITIFGLAMTALWSSLHSIILPLRIADFFPAGQQATYLGLLTVTGLLLAIVVQPIAGAMSDRSGLKWGRRRPYILIGAILTLSFLPGIGLAKGWPILFATYYLLQISANTALGPYLAFIPDLVPGGKRGLASGIKGLLEILGAGISIWLIGNLMGNYATSEGGRWLWLSLGTLAAVFLGTMLATVLMVKEQPGAGGPKLPLLSTLSKTFRIDVKANPDFIRFVLSRLFFIIPLTAFQAFGLYFFRDYLAVANPAATMGNFTLVSSLCMLGMVYPAGFLSDKFGRRPIGLTSGLISAIGIGLLFFFRSYQFILTSAILMGIGFAGLMSSNWALAVDVVPKDEAGKYIGLTNLASAGGSALARLQGPMIDFFNARRFGLGYTAMLLASLTSLIVSSALLWGIKKR
ncbi:MAG: MFS transporter [Chloroflexi bacterium]|nr:MFS transporter [Chloroflexota bacterium]